MTRDRALALGVWAVAAGALLSCGSTGARDDCAYRSSVRPQIVVVPHYTVFVGLSPGERIDQVSDGWTITYQTFGARVNFRAWLVAPKSEAETREVFVPDLHTFSPVAAPSFPGAGSYDFEYTLGAVDVRGTAEKGGEKITFGWRLAATTRFADCARKSGQRGFTVCSNGMMDRAIRLTIHGERWFFTRLMVGPELPELRAEWLKTCDKDRNGDLTLGELKACDARTALPQAPAGPYHLTGVIDHDGDGVISLYDYVLSQAETMGGFDDTGECWTHEVAP